MRRVVLQAVMVLIHTVRGNNPFKSYYESLIARGLKPSVAKINVGRKLLTTMWAMWKRGEVYQPAS